MRNGSDPMKSLIMQPSVLVKKESAGSGGDSRLGVEAARVETVDATASTAFEENSRQQQGRPRRTEEAL